MFLKMIINSIIPKFFYSKSFDICTYLGYNVATLITIFPITVILMDVRTIYIKTKHKVYSTLYLDIFHLLYSNFIKWFSQCYFGKVYSNFKRA